jgi:hypothetical protein
MATLQDINKKATEACVYIHAIAISLLLEEEQAFATALEAEATMVVM